jgi:hypothetical protein
MTNVAAKISTFKYTGGARACYAAQSNIACRIVQAHIAARAIFCPSQQAELVSLQPEFAGPVLSENDGWNVIRPRPAAMPSPGRHASY